MLKALPADKRTTTKGSNYLGYSREPQGNERIVVSLRKRVRVREFPDFLGSKGNADRRRI